jgi:redox-regulated HSP33 family molecular chaperone
MKSEIDISKVPTKLVPLGWFFAGVFLAAMVGTAAVSASGKARDWIKSKTAGKGKVGEIVAEVW